MLKNLKKRVEKEKNSEQAKILQGFFKTGKGQYGEGDIFLGIKVPVQREIAKEFSGLGVEDVQELLNSKIHEERLISLFILIDMYNRADKGGGEKGEKEKKNIFDFYLKNAKQINNWDLVDLSAPKIVGGWLLDKEKNVLYELANSDNLWEKRIAIVSTFAFIRAGEFEDSLKISEILLGDKHDLIHKAIGWMLREVGKRDVSLLEEFIKENYSKMPRTTLRYAIERFEEGKRKGFLRGEF